MAKIIMISLLFFGCEYKEIKNADEYIHKADACVQVSNQVKRCKFKSFYKPDNAIDVCYIYEYGTSGGISCKFGVFE